MADEAEEGGPEPEQESPGEQLSEIQLTLSEHSIYIADNFDKLYDEVELLKANLKATETKLLCAIKLTRANSTSREMFRSSVSQDMHPLSIVCIVTLGQYSGILMAKVMAGKKAATEITMCHKMHSGDKNLLHLMRSSPIVSLANLAATEKLLREELDAKMKAMQEMLMARIEMLEARAAEQSVRIAEQQSLTKQQAAQLEELQKQVGVLFFRFH